MVIIPFNFTKFESAQIATSGPAFAVGAGVIVINFCELTAGQLPEARVESVSVTLPTVASLVEGLYLAFKSVLLGVNCPLPDVLQVAVVALLVPFNKIVFTSEHIFSSGPASTLISGVIVAVTLLESGVQKLLPMEVNICLLYTSDAADE